jgi:cytoskeleton protein RodZ
MTNEKKIPSVGELLKETRESQGKSLDDVAKILYISKRHLISLEENHEDHVCDVYTLGFLKSYAQFLGLDANELCQQFKSQATHTEPSFLPFPAPVPGKGMPSRRIIIFSTLILVAFIVGWKWQDSSQSSSLPLQEVELAEVSTDLPKKVETPAVIPASLPETPLPENSSVVSASSDIAGLIESPAVDPQPLSSPSSVVFKATQEVWIEVKDENGKVILNRVFQPGQTYEFKEPKNLVLKTGNAKGTYLYSGERTFSFPENSEAVQRDISLNRDKWVEQRPDTL